MSVTQNLEKLKNKIGDRTNLLAVSKTKPLEMIEEAYLFGQRDFGENKIQDLFEKAHALSHLRDIRWHFIGTLQSNKLNKLLSVPGLYAIHSIDSLSLVDKLLKKSSGQKIKIFLQVNTSGEEEKSGFDNFEELNQAVQKLIGQESWELAGLMTIGSIRADDFKKAARTCFEQLVALRNRLSEKYDIDLELSMGMSQDYEIAISYGSDWVRIGSDIFGLRE